MTRSCWRAASNCSQKSKRMIAARTALWCRRTMTASSMKTGHSSASTRGTSAGCPQRWTDMPRWLLNAGSTLGTFKQFYNENEKFVCKMCHECAYVFYRVNSHFFTVLIWRGMTGYTSGQHENSAIIYSSLYLFQTGTTEFKTFSRIFILIYSYNKNKWLPRTAKLQKRTIICIYPCEKVHISIL